MSEEFTALPLDSFKTRTNTDLGAKSISIEDDGSVVFRDVLKKVTESMLTSYPRSMLGQWTPNRAAVRYSREQLADRQVKMFASGEKLDIEGILKLAS